MTVVESAADCCAAFGTFDLDLRRRRDHVGITEHGLLALGGNEIDLEIEDSIRSSNVHQAYALCRDLVRYEKQSNDEGREKELWLPIATKIT